MRIFIYSLQTALKSIWKEKWINLLTILSISIGLLIISSFIVLTLNMDFVLKRWARNFNVIVYLHDNISAREQKDLKNFFQSDTGISDMKYISKKEALRELQKTLGNEASILDDFEANPLPSSYELTLKREMLKPLLVKQKSAEIEKMPGVEEVQYGEKWLTSLSTLSQSLKAGTLFFGCAIFVAIAFVTYGTIKIFFYRRKNEIETLKLLGATRTFIRLPFLLEGLFIGIMSGIFSCVLLSGIHTILASRLHAIMPSLSTFMISLPDAAYLSIPVAAAIMSFIGSYVAVGKIRY